MDNALHAIVARSEEDVLFALEVSEEGARRDVRPAGDLRHRDALVASLLVKGERCLDDALTRALFLALAQPA
jgi:hypothetical protein